MINVTWTGCFPTLCFGEWKIEVNGIDYSHLIPEELRESPMNTFGVYRSWYCDKNYGETYEEYIDGLSFEPWYERNPWVDEIPATPYEIYFAFSTKDWRYGMCGGCM